MKSSYSAKAFRSRSVPRIFCIGRNYAAHIAELHKDRDVQKCLVFTKPLSSLVAPGEKLQLPDGRGVVHHETEVVVEIGEGGTDIPADSARQHIRGVGLGLDLTLRSLQSELKNNGSPWERAKAFDYSAPLGPLVPVDDEIDFDDLHFELTIDGSPRQKGHTANMLVGVEQLIAMLSSTWELLPGDLVFTGTPEGIGPVQAGMSLRLSSPQLPGAEWVPVGGH